MHFWSDPTVESGSSRGPGSASTGMHVIHVKRIPRCSELRKEVDGARGKAIPLVPLITVITFIKIKQMVSDCTEALWIWNEIKSAYIMIKDIDMFAVVL